MCTSGQDEDGGWEETKQNSPAREDCQQMDTSQLPNSGQQNLPNLNTASRMVVPPELGRLGLEALEDVQMNAGSSSNEEEVLHPPNPHRTAAYPRDLSSQCIGVKFSTDDPEFFHDDDVPSHYLGPMDQICEFCNARFWNAERTANGRYTACCSEGKIKLHKVQPPPQYIEDLLLGVSSDAKVFLKKSIAYNTSVSFASITMNQHQFPTTKGVPTLRIGGSVYHNIGAVHPDANTQAKFMQCFFHDGSVHENTYFKFTEREIAIQTGIMEHIRDHNPFLRSVREAIQQQSHMPIFQLVISDTPPPNAATRTYNRPTVTEISAIITGDGYSPDGPANRSIIIHNRGGGVKHIPSTHSSYDPLAYAITHIHGDSGWTYDIPKYKKNIDNEWVIDGNKHVTAAEFYAYRMHTRDDPKILRIHEDTLTYGGMRIRLR